MILFTNIFFVIRYPRRSCNNLQILVRGAVNWYRLKAGGPDGPYASRGSLLDSQDHLSAFIRECCTVRADGFVATAEMLDAFKRWCEAEEITLAVRFDSRQLSEAMRNKGFVPDNCSAQGLPRRRGYKGLFINLLGGNM